MGSDVERALTAIEEGIRAVLGRSIRPDENFFDAGLTSVTLVRLHEASTRQLSAQPAVTAMFAYPNLRALRRHLREGQVAAPAVAVRAADTGQLRRAADARRNLRRRIRSEGEQP